VPQQLFRQAKMPGLGFRGRFGSSCAPWCGGRWAKFRLQDLVELGYGFIDGQFLQGAPFSSTRFWG